MGMWIRRSSRLLAALGLALMGALAAAAESGERPPRVLLLHSFGQEFQPFSDAASRFRQELNQRLDGKVDVFESALQTARSGPGLNDAPFVDYLMALTAEAGPDLVVTIGGPAMQFAQRHREQLFPGVPMLFAAVDIRLLEPERLTDSDGAVTFRNDPSLLLENILQVLPDTRHVAVVIGASPHERYWAEEVRRELQPYEGRIDFSWLGDKGFEQMKAEVARLPPHSAILFLLLVVDGAGVPHPFDHGLKELHAVANAPIFGFYSSQVERGMVGGRLIPDAELGAKAAEAAWQILQGAAPAGIRTEPIEAASPIYNWRELQRWGIRDSDLPEGSQVLFREDTMWEKYRPYLEAGLLVLLLQTALIVALVRQNRRRLRAEKEAASLGGRLLMVHEDERRRVARELHDDVTQRLAAMAIEATQLHTGNPSVSNPVKSIRDGLVRLSEDVHALSYRLHPSVIEDLGLAEALRAECDRVNRSGDVSG